MIFKVEVLQLPFFPSILDDWVRLSPIAQNSTLLPSKKYGLFLNPVVVVRPPRPTKRLWLDKRNYQFHDTPYPILTAINFY